MGTGTGTDTGWGKSIKLKIPKLGRSLKTKTRSSSSISIRSSKLIGFVGFSEVLFENLAFRTLRFWYVSLFVWISVNLIMNSYKEQLDVFCGYDHKTSLVNPLVFATITYLTIF